MGAGIDLAREPLHRARTHEFEPEVHNALVGGEDVGVDERKARGELLDFGLEQIDWHRLDREPYLSASAPVTVSPVSSRRFVHWGPTW